jgi:hypothetical protein
MARFSFSRPMAYRRLRRLVEGGLLEAHRPLYLQPGLYVATTEGLRACDMERLTTFRVGPGEYRHASEVARIAASVQRRLPGEWRVESERELRVREADEGRLVGSAKLGELPGGQPRLHRPDLVLSMPRPGVVIAVEVELSTKSPRRLAAICRAWAGARHVDAVVYMAEGATARAVERAVRAAGAEERIVIVALDRPEAALAGSGTEAGCVAA